MKLRKFYGNTDYIRTQRRTVKGRSKHPSFTDVEILGIKNWLTSYTKLEKILCHGVRGGLELDEFHKHFPEAELIGTDLFRNLAINRGVCQSKDYGRVVERDFSKRQLDWVGKFDLIYSNSLDHARHPFQTLQVWIDQLKPDGHLFLQWSFSHINTKDGDCFGACLDEYMQIVEEFGNLLDLIYVKAPWEKDNPLRQRANEVVVLVVGKK